MRNDERAVLAVRKAARSFEPTEDAELLTTCRRQAALIEALMRAVGDLRSGASALKAENADLRSERRRSHRREAEAAVADAPRGGHVEAQVPLGVHAPAMARRIVADALRERVPSSAIDNALLTISELVTNSVCHGLSADGGYAIVRLRLTDESLLLEAEDPRPGWPRDAGATQRSYRRKLRPAPRRDDQRTLGQRTPCQRRHARVGGAERDPLGR